MAGHSTPDTVITASSVDKTAQNKHTQFAKDVAFGTRQTITCFLTDFIDPVVGLWFQKKSEDEHHKGTAAHSVIGEVVGDSVAVFMFLGQRKWFPQPINMLKNGIAKMRDKAYTKEAKKILRAEHIPEDAPDYQQKLDAWKDAQAENFANTTVLTAKYWATPIPSPPLRRASCSARR